MQYVIVGDAGKYKDCLVTACGSSMENATKVLNRYLTAPTANDILTIGECKNLRIKETDDKDAWWDKGD